MGVCEVGGEGGPCQSLSGGARSGCAKRMTSPSPLSFPDFNFWFPLLRIQNYRKFSVSKLSWLSGKYQDSVC